MGDRAQIGIKQPTKKDPDARVYLYTHWGGSDIYKALKKVFKEGACLDDSEYLSRIIFREMGAGEDGETGYGIGLEAHGDIQHVIPVLDCDAGVVSFENPDWEHNRAPDLPKPMQFSAFVDFPVPEGW